jgi:hypothetical protein
MGECGGRKTIFLSMSDMSRRKTIVERHNFESRQVARPAPSAKRVDSGNLQYPIRCY